MKVIILLILSSLSNVAVGQIQLADTVYKEINKLRVSKQDTIIRFGLPNFVNATKDSLPGIGNIPALGVEYIVYKKQNRTYSIKFVEHCTEDCNNIMISISKPIEQSNDSLFLLLSKSIEIIRNEEILPYIYQVKTDSSNVAYDLVFTSHPPVFFIGIYTFKDDISKSVNSLWLTERNSNIFPLNLNLKHNVKTSLNKLFQKLQRYTNLIDHLYVFK